MGKRHQTFPVQCRKAIILNQILYVLLRMKTILFSIIRSRYYLFDYNTVGTKKYTMNNAAITIVTIETVQTGFSFFSLFIAHFTSSHK